MQNFTDTGVNEILLKAITDLGFEMPTPIQARVIPHILSSERDLIAFAQTGTGKTAAFGLPAIQLTDISDKTTQTLILCPTRELCMQIVNDLKNYSKYLKGMGIVAIYGGAKIDAQVRALTHNAQIVVATPGRAKDMIRRKKLKLNHVRRVVLDEADEMLTMGFKEDLEAILAETPDEKHTLLFSATLPKGILTITRKYMDNPVEISVARRDSSAENIDHLYYRVHANDRYELLKRIADINPKIYGIVFCRTRKDTKEVANKLMHDGYNADAIHGDLSQSQRDEVMNRFRTHRLQLLVATDVAARGLDVTDLTHIINYTLPDDAEIYIHRSGRTGRAGKSGTSIAIIHTRESRKIKEIEKRFKIRFIQRQVPSGKDICTKQLYTLIDKIEKVEVNEQQIGPFLPAIFDKLEWLSREELIKHFVSAEFNRFLEYYRNARDLNIPDSRKRENRDHQDQQQVRFAKLFINVGSEHGLTAQRLMGMINEGMRSNQAAVGKIEVMKRVSFFEVEYSIAARLIPALTGQVFEGEFIYVEFAKENKSTPKKNHHRTPHPKKHVLRPPKTGGKKPKSRSEARKKRRKKK